MFMRLLRMICALFLFNWAFSGRTQANQHIRLAKHKPTPKVLRKHPIKHTWLAKKLLPA